MSPETPFRFIRGNSPLLISVPHAGTELSPGLESCLSDEARKLPDTDFWVDRLYEFAPDMGASMLIARYSRYVVDLNRPPDNAALYDREVPGLFPFKTFSGAAVYRPGDEPTKEQRSERLELFWQPYHRKLRETLVNLRREFGHAILLDAHSITSKLPLLFDGELPVMNLGSNDGRSAGSSVYDAAWDAVSNSDFSAVRDGRFKGGYITRQYGRPRADIHALQLEMAQRAYMQESPPRWLDIRADSVRIVLRDLVRRLLSWRPGSG